MNNQSAFYNRLQKNLKKLKPLLKDSIEAYRLYSKDMPEYPYIIEMYKDHCVIWEKGRKIDSSELKQKSVNNQAEVEDALKATFTHLKKIIWKRREKQTKDHQYQKLQSTQNEFQVKEYDLSFIVNLEDYLDTGLFVDHRPLRKWLYHHSKDLQVLNLFCYTGALSIAAQKGGAQKVISVDLSKTYINWALRNYKINKLQTTDYELIQEDVFQFLKKHDQSYDLIILDPPVFSRSKRMENTLDIQRDHIDLIKSCMSLLKAHKDAVCIFSNNLRTFKMSDEIYRLYKAQDKSSKFLPLDISDTKQRSCFEIRHHLN